MIDDDETALATLRQLPSDDVSGRRAQSLRERCHVELRQRSATLPAESRISVAWRRHVGPALIGAWSAIYLIQTLRTAAALYGF
jgi:hypothetical protein